MQLRGSYQKRSKQERLKGLDIKKPNIAAKRNEPLSYQTLSLESGQHGYETIEVKFGIIVVFYLQITKSPRPFSDSTRPPKLDDLTSERIE